MLLLVAHPEVQDWLHEEIELYTRNQDHKQPAYNETFPKLKRCLAVLLETAPLQSTSGGVPKYTGSKSADLVIDSHSYHIPAGYLVVPHLQALHTQPRHWGSDSLVWRPGRWIENPGDPEKETIFNPPKGTYFSWAEGIRNCPGQKFAQVEFVATLTALFKHHVAEPVPLRNESMQAARKRTLDILRIATFADGESEKCFCSMVRKVS